MDQGRKLGFWETGTALFHDDAAGAGIILIATYINGKIDHALLKQALHLLFQRHPLLRATIHRTKAGYFFKLNADFHAVPVRFINRDGEQRWLEVGEKELNVLFPTHEYLWRAALISSKDGQNELILSFHHAIIDGYSCVHFIDELLRLYIELDMQTFMRIEPLPLLEPIEKLVTFHPTKESIADEVAKTTRSGLTELAYQTYAPVGKRTTKNHVAIIPPEELQGLKERCHQNQASINSVLYAALLLAQQRVLGKTLDTVVSSPVNLRDYCEPAIDDDQIGLFVSWINELTGEITANTSIWELARNYQLSHAHAIPKLAFLPENVKNEELEIYCPIFNLESLHHRRAFAAACSLTNMGQFDFPAIYGSLKLEGFFVTMSRQAGHVQINLSATSILQRLYLCFSYPHPLVHTDYIEEVAKQFKSILKSNIT